MSDHTKVNVDHNSIGFDSVAQSLMSCNQTKAELLLEYLNQNLT